MRPMARKIQKPTNPKGTQGELVAHPSQITVSATAPQVRLRIASIAHVAGERQSSDQSDDHTAQR